MVDGNKEAMRHIEEPTSTDWWLMGVVIEERNQVQDRLEIESARCNIAED